MGWLVALIIAIIVVLVWGIVGGTYHPSGAFGPVPTGEGCASCKGLSRWYSGLSKWNKLFEFAWYCWKRGDCWLKGCSTD